MERENPIKAVMDGRSKLKELKSKLDNINEQLQMFKGLKAEAEEQLKDCLNNLQEDLKKIETVFKNKLYVPLSMKDLWVLGGTALEDRSNNGK